MTLHNIKPNSQVTELLDYLKTLKIDAVARIEQSPYEQGKVIGKLEIVDMLEAICKQKTSKKG